MEKSATIHNRNEGPSLHQDWQKAQYVARIRYRLKTTIGKKKVVDNSSSNAHNSMTAEKERIVNEAQHIAAIEDDLRQTVEGRGRAGLDDVDAAMLLKELARLRNKRLSFVDVYSQLSEWMGELKFSINGIVAHPDLSRYDVIGTTMNALPEEYVTKEYVAKYEEDDLTGYRSDSYFPIFLDNDNVLYLHVTWTE